MVSSNILHLCTYSKTADKIESTHLVFKPFSPKAKYTFFLFLKKNISDGEQLPSIRYIANEIGVSVLTRTRGVHYWDTRNRLFVVA